MNEGFEWSVEKKQNKEGNDYYIAYIDPNLSTESTYEVKDQIKKYGGKWDSTKKTWYFILSNDPAQRESQIARYLKPCVRYLKSMQQTSSRFATTDQEVENILKTIDELINDVRKINTSLTTEVNTAADPKEIEERLAAFKQELIKAFSDGTWKQMMEPILKFRDAQGASFSLKNRILIWIQDPEATLVKSKSKWKAFNKTVKPDAPALFMWMPHGQLVNNTKQAQFEDSVVWLIQNGKLGGDVFQYLDKSKYVYDVIKKLSPGDKERMNKYVYRLDNSTVSFKLEPRWYDVRFTEQMPDTEDLVGDPNAGDDLEWFDGTSNETEKTVKLYNAVAEVIQETGIKLVFGDEKSLGGARGVSKSGEIEVLQGIPKNAGAISTLVHEFSHEMLHQTYLKNSSEDYADYFVGTSAGRELVEQQAEISAWIVMRNFGYSMRTAVNYIGCWGGDEKGVMKAFDTVANVSSKIINEITKKLSTMKESKNMNEAVNLTGRDVANMLGQKAVQLYNDSERLNQETNESIDKVKNEFFEFFDRMNKEDKFLG